jgi:hypothetical protein
MGVALKAKSNLSVAFRKFVENVENLEDIFTHA